jgi:hypothetical protein
VKKKKGKEAAVVSSDRSKLEGPDEVCMSQVATVLWAAMKTSETKPDNHSHKKTRFFSANHTECFSLLATLVIYWSFSYTSTAAGTAAAARIFIAVTHRTTG